MVPLQNSVKIFKRIAPLIVLGLIAGFSWWMKGMVEPSSPMRNGKTRPGPDYYMENFVVTAMHNATDNTMNNNNGTAHYRLKAEHMDHYSDIHQTQFIKPQLTIYQEDVAPWTIDAERGVVWSRENEIFLAGTVVIRRLPTERNSAIELVTRDVYVDTRDHFAETDQPVVLRDRTGTTKAIGLRVNMKQQRLHLLSKVRGVYVVR